MSLLFQNKMFLYVYKRFWTATKISHVTMLSFWRDGEDYVEAEEWGRVVSRSRRCWSFMFAKTQDCI